MKLSTPTQILLGAAIGAATAALFILFVLLISGSFR